VEKISGIQLAFWRQQLKLPKATPKFFTLLERNSPPTKCFLIKQTLKYWAKILMLEQTNIVRICYEVLRADNIEKPQNRTWITNLKKILVEHDLGALWEKQNGPIILNKLHNTHKNLEITEWYRLVQIMRASNFLKQYKNIKTHVKTELYWNAKLTWDQKLFVLYLRLNISHFLHKGRVYRLNALEHLYHPETPISCQICNTNDKDDIYHIIT